MPQMHLPRPLLAAGVPVALGLGLAAPALAAPSGGRPVPSVSVRVEGLKGTLLPARTVRAPSSGSITRGGAPAGTCLADTAAGALDVATRHHWGGTYSSGLGIEVTNILGTTYSYSHGSYWGFYVNDRFASAGVCDTKLHAGEQLLFAAVPAKGRTPLPIVVRAPQRVRAGRPFRVRTFVDTGHGSATRPVTGARFAVDETGHATGRGSASIGRTSSRGVTTLTVRPAGTVRIVASHAGDIRSAVDRITVTR